MTFQGWADATGFKVVIMRTVLMCHGKYVNLLTYSSREYHHPNCSPYSRWCLKGSTITKQYEKELNMYSKEYFMLYFQETIADLNHFLIKT
jgi:hypothetical protein